MTHKITIGGKEYWYDLEWKILLYDNEKRRPVRVQFFKEEEYKEYLKKVKDLGDSDLQP